MEIDRQIENTAQAPLIKEDLVQVYESSAKIRFRGHLEQRYQRDYSAKNLTYFRVTMCAATILYIASGLVDWMLLDAQLAAAWQVRYWVVSPVLILISIFSFTEGFARYQQLAIVFSVIIASLSLVWIWGKVDSSIREFYYTGTLIMEMAGLSISRIQFRYAVMTTILIPLFSFSLMLIEGTLLVSHFITYGYFFLSVAVICLSSTYFLERSSRRDFLQKLLLSLEQKDLRDANEHLKELVDFDALTGIANRRHFDQSLVEEWKRADRGQYKISIMMVDIDHFKLFNDRYGHQAGDECLKKIAKVLETFGKRPGDLVARYGGEEFCIILPGSNAANGERVAHQIIKAVRQANIENKGSPVKPIVTVSIGGGSCVPDTNVTAQDLLKVADEQLYMAKNEGRDRITWRDLNG